jgi:prevent-host-death family protein
MSSYPLYDAKARLTALVHQVEAGPEIEISRHGKTVAILMGKEQYNAITSGQRTLKGALKSYQDYLAELREQFTDDPFEGVRNRDEGRPVDL